MTQPSGRAAGVLRDLAADGELERLRAWFPATRFTVDPARIDRRVAPPLHGLLSQHIPARLVVGGSWDRFLVAYGPHPVVAERLAARHGGELGGTAAATSALDTVRSSRYRTAEARAARAAGIDRLLESLETDGFRAASGPVEPPLDEIGILVTRDGRLVWAHRGDHRLSAAQLLGIDAVPVVVHGLHAAFVDGARTAAPAEAALPAIERALARVGIDRA